MPAKSKRPSFRYEPAEPPRFKYPPDSEHQVKLRFEYQPGPSVVVPSPPPTPTGCWLSKFIPIYLDKHEKPFGV